MLNINAEVEAFIIGQPCLILGFESPRDDANCLMRYQ